MARPHHPERGGVSDDSNEKESIVCTVDTVLSINRLVRTCHVRQIGGYILAV